MIDYLDVNNVRVAGDNGSRAVTLIDGLFGTTGVRGQFYDRPEAHGSVEAPNAYMPYRLVIIEGEVSASSIPLAFQEFSVVDAAFRGALDTLVPVRWRAEAGSTDVEGWARLAGPVTPKLTADERGPRIMYQAQLRFPDPVWRTVATSSASTGVAATTGGIPFPIPFKIPFSQSSTSGTVTVTNTGDSPAWPTVTVTGPTTGLRIQCQTTGVMMEFPLLNMVAGQYLTIATATPGRAAMLDGVNVQGEVDWSVSGWPSAPPGASTWAFQSLGGGTTSDTTLTVAWQSGYVSPF